MSIESIINQSLDMVGYKRHIGSIWDGSAAARVALNAYAETRDEVLAMQPWMFARAFATLSTSAVLTPPVGLRVWARPANAIVILDVYQSTLMTSEPTRWFERYHADTRLILTSFLSAEAAMTQRVLDPDDWSPDFTSVVIQALARKLAPLVGAPPKEDEKQ